MMPIMRVSDATWSRLQTHARPFVDKPEDIVNLALDALDEKLGQKPKPELKSIAELLGQKKPRSAKKLPQKEFRQPLLDTLIELGGTAHVSEIKSAMEKKIAALLSAADYEKVSTGEVRWWNAACWERSNMVRDGLIAESSERGVWELTKKGKTDAQ
jgi:chemotaxis response regulator CheB